MMALLSSTRRGAVLAMSAATVALATLSANADTFYNTLDTTVDSQLEVLNLTTGGAPATVTIALQIDGHNAGDHPGCNLNGAPHHVQLVMHNSNPSAATAAWTSGVDTFWSCTDTLGVRVTPVALGTTTITFTQGDSDLANDPQMQFNYGQAAFTVNVTAGSTTGGPGTGCDQDPAAPAWAAAILQANGLKAKAATNYISSIAHMMGTGATFQGIVKNAHPDYENAVWTQLKTVTGQALPNGPTTVHRPDWECAPVS
jgi:hypothetical protein